MDQSGDTSVCIYSNNALQRRKIAPRLPYLLDNCCKEKRCRCSCHIVVGRGSRFWRWSLPTLSSIAKPCNYRYCQDRHYEASLWIALSRMGIPFAVKVNFALNWGNRGLSIIPALEFPVVKKFTSPGFE